MRLLDVNNRKVVEFLSNVPSYAILSHTWEDEEVTYQDMLIQDTTVMAKKGYTKILEACKLAAKDEQSYIWIDTCCIDKTSSSELSEAINSMFEWYRGAFKCYAYLSDSMSTSADLTQCRWFTRGWTLQELLAPTIVEFYDRNWSFRGDKTSWGTQILERAQIPIECLVNVDYMLGQSTAVKMSWAANRRTTRIEDMAYCLLGLFDVNMALLYGEGGKSFRRLQEEILKKSNDLTILTWDARGHNSILAPSVSCFSSEIASCTFPNIHDVAFTTRGLHFRGQPNMHTFASFEMDVPKGSPKYFLPLAYSPRLQVGGLRLHKIGPNLFCRDTEHPFVGFRYANPEEYLVLYTLRPDDFYILPYHPESIPKLATTFRDVCFHFPRDLTWSVTKVSPEHLWDETDRVFLRTHDNRAEDDSVLLIAMLETQIIGRFARIGVICEFYKVKRYIRVSRLPKIMLFDPGEWHEESLVFTGKPRYAGVPKALTKTYGLDLSAMQHTVELSLQGQTIHVTATLEWDWIQFSMGRSNVYRVELETSVVESADQICVDAPSRGSFLSKLKRLSLSRS